MASRVERSVQLSNRQGLHARPISRILEVASRHEAPLEVAWEGQRVDGRSIFELMTLAAGCGSTLTFSAEGKDAERLVDALVRLVEEKFGED